MLLLKDKIKGIFVSLCFLLLVAPGCGSDGVSLELTSVLGIPKGNKEGTGLTGTFTAIFEITSDGCRDYPILEVSKKGTASAITVEVEHDGGFIGFQNIEGTLRGGVNFDNSFEVGGLDAIDRGGNEGNIIRSVYLKGRFDDPNKFSGQGRQRFYGRVEASLIDCTITFKVQQGIRQEGSN